MRISEPSFTDSGIDATGKTENQTCTRVDGRSAPSTLSLPKSASAGGLGIPYPIPISSVILGVVRRGEVPPFGACADGPEDVSDAANGRGRGSRGEPPCTAKRSLV